MYFTAKQCSAYCTSVYCSVGTKMFSNAHLLYRNVYCTYCTYYTSMFSNSQLLYCSVLNCTEMFTVLYCTVLYCATMCPVPFTFGPNEESLSTHSIVKRRVKIRLKQIKISMKQRGAPSNFSIRRRVFKIIRSRIKFSKGAEVTNLQMWYLKPIKYLIRKS